MNKEYIYTQSIVQLLHGIHKALYSTENTKGEFDTLTMQQLRSLMYLNCKGKATMKELAEEMKITPASTTSLVTKLVQKDLVERVLEPMDRRVVFIVLTPNSREKLDAMMYEKMHRLSKYFAAMSEEHRVGLHEGLTALNHEIEYQSDNK